MILVINCGSSSAKYELFDIKRHNVLAKGIVERIGDAHCPNHYSAIKKIIEELTDPKKGALKDIHQIEGIGHRVVHGQEEFKSSCLITDAVIRSLEKYSSLAPLHNPPSIAGIKACANLLKGIPQVAVFDTSFHQTIPPYAFLYGLPYEFYKKHSIRRYGFHGTSHRYVSEATAKALKRPLSKLKLITCHLGNGCSMAAVDGGKSVDTSMGLTPLEGLIMGTRSGDVDPASVLYILEKEGIALNQMNDILNKKSGLLGISGISNDMRDLLKAAAKGDKRAKLAIEMFIYKIKKYIGAYYAAMGGLDAVVFTAGIGEHSPWLIKRIKNDLKDVVKKNVQFLVIPTNEELLIAKDTCEIIKNQKPVTRNQ